MLYRLLNHSADLKSLPHQFIAGNACTARMNAAHLFVIRPDRHHGIQVGTLQRIIERGFSVLRRGKNGLLQLGTPGRSKY